MDDVTIALALHVLAVVHWIGGLAFVTLIVLPLARMRSNAGEGVALFSAVEQRFAAQVRFSIPTAGATGLWMTYRMNLWGRFVDPQFWWMSAMFGVWLIFMLMIFVMEPMLHARFERKAQSNPGLVLRRITSFHTILLGLSTLTIFGTVAGTHGLFFF
jgi:uncharacterized membrane protein